MMRGTLTSQALLAVALAATARAYIADDFHGTLTDKQGTYDLRGDYGGDHLNPICGVLKITVDGADGANKGAPYQLSLEQRARYLVTDPASNDKGLYHTIKTVPQPVWITDPDGKGGSWNLSPDQACRDFQITVTKDKDTVYESGYRDYNPVCGQDSES